MINPHQIDPLQEGLKTTPFQAKLIERITCGKKLTAVILKNGNMGVCTNLSYQACCKIEELEKANLDDISKRIPLIAYLNAVQNPLQKVDYGDIFQILNFEKNSHNVMIGHFIPLVEKFDKAKIPIDVFDIAREHKRLCNYSLLETKLKTSQNLIISSTTLMNKSLFELLEKTNSKSKIYLLGPSSLLSNHYKKLNITAIFGTHFGQNNIEVENLIAKGYGSREFLKFSKKVVYYL